ncbi:BrnA antitoxin family protein [Lysobacter sp. A6]|uniref:BrnA antitoxin family protein n=1 Tax=Noviluteimonas lactosilytica TaxID=2888523 RepID=A0ABS8JLA9_9GAMM|nr:BrnA antitoxin family protein [Lysobacter lactosilyticus]
MVQHLRPARTLGVMTRELDFSKGRRGPVLPIPQGKTRITIYIDDEVLDMFREQADRAGRGYQGAMNNALRQSLGLPPTDDATR